MMAAGFATWVWLLPGLVSGNAPLDADGMAVSELAPVADKDIAAALTTMGGSKDFLAQFKTDRNSCPAPLAWVSLVGGAAQSPVEVRIRSGAYVSPIFTPGRVPTRIAIPYPAPYAAGHGVLAAIDVGGDVTIALQPAWHISPSTSGPAQPKEVSWLPVKRCIGPS
jgi:hypothetical protein